MRTPGIEIVHGRWAWSLVGDSFSEAFPVDGIAVLVCYMMLGPVVMRNGPAARIKRLQGEFGLPNLSTVTVEPACLHRLFRSLWIMLLNT